MADRLGGAGGASLPRPPPPVADPALPQPRRGASYARTRAARALALPRDLAANVDRRCARPGRARAPQRFACAGAQPAELHVAAQIERRPTKTKDRVRR